MTNRLPGRLCARLSIDQINIAGQSTFNAEEPSPLSAGLNPSYACSDGPNFDQWLLFAGLSGQSTDQR